MNFAVYLKRVVKYVIYLAILLGVLFLVMDLTGTSKVPLKEIFNTSESVYFFVAVFLFSLISPFTSYTTKRLTFDAVKNVDEVVRVMAMSGYRRVEGDSAEEMVFTAESFVKRLALRFEDRVVVSTKDGESKMNGPRREVVRASFRMTSFIG